MHTGTRSESLRLMLVEDKTVDAILLECIVEDLGHSVDAVAVTSFQAERMLQCGNDKVDLVVFDALLLGMPSGRLSAVLAEKGIPAVVTSAMPESDVRGLGIDAPYLAQPFNEASVDRALRSAMAGGMVAAA